MFSKISWAARYWMPSWTSLMTTVALYGSNEHGESESATPRINAPYPPEAPRLRWMVRIFEGRRNSLRSLSTKFRALPVRAAGLAIMRSSRTNLAAVETISGSSTASRSDRVIWCEECARARTASRDRTT